MTEIWWLSESQSMPVVVWKICVDGPTCLWLPHLCKPAVLPDCTSYYLTPKFDYVIWFCTKRSRSDGEPILSFVHFYCFLCFCPSHREDTTMLAQWPSQPQPRSATPSQMQPMKLNQVQLESGDGGNEMCVGIRHWVFMMVCDAAGSGDG
jgi:hypothetical protein